jgi:hypothetical protein
MNQHGTLGVGLDVKRVMAMLGYSPLSGSSGASAFASFYIKAKDGLKGMDILKRFMGSAGFRETELQGIYSRIDFSL